jgi:hypothetical protein
MLVHGFTIVGSMVCIENGATGIKNLFDGASF